MIKRTSETLLQTWLDEPEGNHCEFKEAKERYDFEKLINYCVALANEGGGRVILGVSDKRPREIVGTKAFLEPDRTEAGLYERLNQRIPVEELITSQGRLVIVHVPSRLPGSAWQNGGKYLKRAGDALVAMGPEELRAILTEIGPDFSAEICQDAQITNLSESAIHDYRARWAKKTNDARKLEWSTAEVLTNAELIVDGQLTYAALILFGTREALGRYLGQAEIVFEYRSQESAGPAAERQDYRIGFFLSYDELWQKINLRNDRQSYQDGLFRMEIPTFDEASVREALLNAVAHRDYRLGGSVFVKQYAKRLEIMSPGGFPAGITTENILDQQNPRNRRLAEAFAKCGFIERSGQGMNLMFENAIQQGKALPNFSGTSAHEVRLILEGVVQSPAFVRFIERLGKERLKTFSSYDFLTLDYINRDQSLPESLKSRIPSLLEIGAIESFGRGRGTRYILSRSLHTAMGARGVHTRKRGLDHETNKALLEKHLKHQAIAGSPLSELRQVLPSLSESAVKRLLHEMRTERRAQVIGQRRWARWFPIQN